MTPKRPSAASSDFITTAAVNAGDQIVRAVWNIYGDQITQVTRSFADGARAAASDAARRLAAEAQAAAVDAARRLGDEVRAAFGEAGRRFADGVWVAAGDAVRGAR